MQSLFAQRPLLGQPFGGMPASAYVPAAAILPTSSPSMFPVVTMPPEIVMPPSPVVFEAYVPPAVAGPSATTVAYAAAGLVGLGLLAYMMSKR